MTRKVLKTALWLFVVCHLHGAVRGVVAAPHTGDDEKNGTLVQIPVLVTNERGEPVRDLLPSDFEVIDDGTPQSVAFVRRVSHARHESGGQDFTCVEGSQVPPRAGEIQGSDATLEPEDAAFRSYIVILIEPMSPGSRSLALRSIRTFLKEKAIPTDYVAIADSSHIVQAFTNDHAESLQKLDAIGKPLRDKSRNFLWYLPVVRLVKSLAALPGRKSLIAFTETGLGASGAYLTELALDANLALYPVEIRGLFNGLPIDWALENFLPLPHFSLQVNALMSSLRRLDFFAEASGGRAVRYGNKLARVFDRALEDSRDYYILGYRLPNLQSDGKFHRVEVKVGKPGVNVRAKAGYFAPKDFASLPRADKIGYMQEALLTDRSFHDIDIQAAASFFPETAKEPVVVPIATELRWTYPVEASPLRHRSMAVMAILRHAGTGDVAGLFSDHQYWPTDAPSARNDFLADLAPGSYVMKIVAGDFETNALGSRTFFIQVPETSAAGPVQLSSLVVAQARAALDSTQETAGRRARGKKRQLEAADPLRVEEWRLLPHVSNVFSPDEKLTLFARVYTRGDAAELAKEWTATAQIRDPSGAVVAGPAPIPIPRVGGKTGGLPLMWVFDVRSLPEPEGHYRAEFHLTHRLSQARVSTATDFLILP